MAKSLTQKVINGMKWKTIERFSVQAMNAVVPIILARLLTPDDFGTIAILTVFTSVAKSLVNNGLCNALIQRQNVGTKECSTVFYTQVVIAFICYILLFFAAPFIAMFYEDPRLTLLLRVMSINIIIGSFTAMQLAILKKNMQFHKSFAATISATIVYAVVGISLAMRGFNYWSLAYANIANQLTLFIVYSLVVKWRPTWEFSFASLKDLFGYSWKLSVGWLIGTLHQDIYSLVIGKRFSRSILGFYNRAMSIPHIILKTVTEVYDGVMFPALSKIQDSCEKLKATTIRMLKVNTFILFPVYFGLSAVGHNLILVLLTAKWLPSAPMMSIMCITFAFNSLNNSNMQVFNSMGRSDIFMKFEMIKRSISIVLLIAFSFINIYAVILILLFMALLSNGMNAYQNKKLLDITITQQLKCVLPSLLCASVMWVVVVLLGKLKMNILLVLVLQVLAGGAVYLLLAFIFRLEALMYLFKQTMGIINKKRG